MFKAHPCCEGGAKGKVKESLVGYGQEDEDWRKGEEDDDKAMEVVVVWLEAV